MCEKVHYLNKKNSGTEIARQKYVGATIKIDKFIKLISANI
jgi:hypothetical protein